MTKRSDFYTLLGLLRTATQEEIRRAYLKAAKRLHPDTNQAPGETELFLEVQQAYQVLSDAARRSAYDASLSEAETAPDILEQHVVFSRQSLPALKESQLLYALINLAPGAAQKKATEAVPLNLCLVLDCSTSMKGEKLDMVKATAIQLIRKLKPQDIFSLVTFSDHAEVLIPAARHENIHKLETATQHLQTGGGTEIFQGLRTGFAEVRRFASRNTLSHLILLTDGRTYGDEGQCYELAKQAAGLKIGISGLGIGSGWNDIFLDQLALTTGGTCMHVSHPLDIERLLNEKFSNLSKTFAESVTLSFQLPSGVRLKDAFRLHPEAAPLGVESPLPLGPILQDAPLSVLFEFLIRPLDEPRTTLELLAGSFEVTSAALNASTAPVPIHLTVAVRDNLPSEPPPPMLVQALSKLTLYRMQEKARAEIVAGDYARATQHLQRMATQLYAQGERNLAQTIMLEVENIQKVQAFSPEGEKLIKYGTRALLLPGDKSP
jgi:Ca-activated chloride channel family protein